MSSVAEKIRYTPEQYLALERKSEWKHEYYKGEIFAMAGESREHNFIEGDLDRALGNQLEGRPCELYIANMRVRVSPTGLYTYPDIVVRCGEPEFLDREFDTLLNPTLIVEVLSPSTEAYDRGRKFEHYGSLDSLREYVLVAQDRVHVERFTRQGERWVLERFTRRDDVLALDSIGCAVALRAIYARVDVPEGVMPEVPPEARGERGQENRAGPE